MLRRVRSGRAHANEQAITGGYKTPGEARLEEDLNPVKGGDTCYLQQQNFSLEALAKRDALPNPFVIDRPTANPTPSDTGPAAIADAPPEPQKAFEDFMAAVLKGYPEALNA